MPEIGEAKPNLVYIKEDQEDDMFIDDGPDISQVGYKEVEYIASCRWIEEVNTGRG